MKTLLAMLALVPIAGNARAATITFELPGSEPPTRQTFRYDCGEGSVGATYINTGTNALAILELGDVTIVTVNVLAASGAKYAGQQYVWWTKGDEADLYDITQGEDLPAAHCTRSD